MSDSAPRLLIISHDVVGRRMAGPGIRAWETARALAASQPVTLVAPRPIDMPGAGFATGDYAWGAPGALDPWLAHADVVLANGFALRGHPELALAPQPLALDLYDPVILEELEAGRSAEPAERAARSALMRDLLRRQLACGDFFLCATERQRDLYVGALMGAGRVTPEVADADPRLRGLIDVAPFGLPQEPPARQGPGLRASLPGVAADDPLLLWTGGMWDWLDPVSLVEAMPAVLARQPRARVVFLAGRHPGAVQAMRAPEEARAAAERLGLLGVSVFMHEEWVPYERRADLLLDADVAVSLHRDTLETAYAAVRSRFLDHLWAGLPSLVTGGDAAAALVERHRLGRVVPPGDPAAVAAAALALLGDAAERRACGERARALAAELTWARAAEPAARFCRSPRRTRPAAPEAARPAAAHAARAGGGPAVDSHRQIREAVAALHERWRLVPTEPGSALPLVGRAKQLANTLTRWYVRPLVDQQNEFNAAAVHAVQALADAVERLAAAQEPLAQHVADIEQHLLDVDDAQTALARRMAE